MNLIEGTTYVKEVTLYRLFGLIRVFEKKKFNFLLTSRVTSSTAESEATEFFII